MFSNRIALALMSMAHQAISSVSYQHHAFHDLSLRIGGQDYEGNKGKQRWEDRSCYTPHQGPREMARRKARWSMSGCQCIEGKLKGHTAIAINVKKDSLRSLGFLPGDVIVQLDDKNHEWGRDWHKVNPSAWALRSREHDKYE